MRFLNTYRYSPVANKVDLPWEDDYYFLNPEEVTKKYLLNAQYDIDDEWHNKQRENCCYGLNFKNSIEPGGDYIRDEIDCFWNDSKQFSRYVNIIGKDIPPNSCYIPQYDLLIKDRTIHISGRLYWYLNFWKLYGLGQNGETTKDRVAPKFTDNDFFFARRIQMMFEQAKNSSEAKARQKGYEQPHSEPVLTSEGWKTMGDVKVGDKVVTRKNTLATITEVFPQGKKDVYELTLMDGRTVRCGENHLWKVYNKRLKQKKEVVLSTRQMIDWGLTKKVNGNKNVSYQFALPDIDPVEFNEQDLKIDPYLLGLLLGDGTINKQLKISSIDKEILDSIQDILGEDYSLNFDNHSNCNYRIVYKDVHDTEQHKRYDLNRQIKLNPLKEELKRLDLLKVCIDKFIPDIYKHSSIKQRLELVRGLMDSDGYISTDGCMEFKNCSKRLSKDLTYILRSLGVDCKISEFESKDGFKNYFRVYIKTTRFNLFKLSRKAELFNPHKKIYKRK